MAALEHKQLSVTTVYALSARSNPPEWSLSETEYHTTYMPMVLFLNVLYLLLDHVCLFGPLLTMYVCSATIFPLIIAPLIWPCFRRVQHPTITPVHLILGYKYCPPTQNGCLRLPNSFMVKVVLL